MEKMQTYQEKQNILTKCETIDDFERFLEEKYPKLFKGCFGFDSGRGWWPLIWQLAEYLESVRGTSPDVSFAQVKEKFAKLRIYLNNVSNIDMESCNRMLVEIEDMSEFYCERCGQTDSVTTAPIGYWLKNYCDTCRAEKNK